ncbi:MAG: acetyl-CoA carboxylase biotin carboxylase subunit [Deltaproteobacteria bacterium]|jgi:propionyl-CoA carboxylase alpha chain|nr:acetyl-CoA carboxylase biotin carboxylase subunit [Deltaproteobacteria bacterium]
MFDKILIANRGEIAVRIIRTCKKLGIKTVAVFSEIDSRALHVQEADESVYLGPPPSEQSYLLKDKIIAAALEKGCQAIHPGYGFLSENAEFAEMTVAADLVFIGPPASVIAMLGDKIASKNLAIQAGVPVVPGHNHPVSDLEEVRTIAENIGYPVLLKPAAGGGGRGMRIAHRQDELEPALKAGQEETRKAFGDNKIFLERYVETPRHIEIQIMADQHGNVIYLGERECSIQRRYQKVIEEAPSLALTSKMRREIGERACSLASEAGYTNAGTVEFILDPRGNFYFLEMNTRLQVEHPVTELVTGLDLVELQLQVAAGQPLQYKQEDITLKGWSIEARICAEEPDRNFLPSTGIITRYAEPRGKKIRMDSGIMAGSRVSVYYDNMLTKAISWGENREDARKNLIQALNKFHLEGVIINADFANAILNHPAFIEGRLSTDFIAEHFEQGTMKIDPPREHLELMVIACTLVYHNRLSLVRESLKPMTARVGPEHRSESWYEYVVKGEKNIFSIRLLGHIDSHQWDVQVNEKQFKVITPDFEFYRRRLKLTINGQTEYFRLQYRENFFWAAFCGINRIFEVYSPREWELAQYMPRQSSKTLDNVLLSPMPGLAVDIRVKKGDSVFRGQDIVVIESMKMESGVASPCDGEVDEVHIKIGQALESGDVLITFKT